MRGVQILYRSKSPRPKSSLKSAMVLLWRILRIHQWPYKSTQEFKPQNYIDVCQCLFVSFQRKLLELNMTYYLPSLVSVNTFMEATGYKVQYLSLHIQPFWLCSTKLRATTRFFRPHQP